MTYQNKTYFLELNKQEINTLKEVCTIGYQIAKENMSLKLMLNSSKLKRRLNDLERRVK